MPTGEVFAVMVKDLEHGTRWQMFRTVAEIVTHISLLEPRDLETFAVYRMLSTDESIAICIMAGLERGMRAGNVPTPLPGTSTTQ